MLCSLIKFALNQIAYLFKKIYRKLNGVKAIHELRSSTFESSDLRLKNRRKVNKVKNFNPLATLHPHFS